MSQIYRSAVVPKVARQVATGSRNSERLVGHLYVLASPKCEYVKVGGTDYAPMKRIKEINSCELI